MDGGLFIGQKSKSKNRKALLTIRSPQWRSAPKEPYLVQNVSWYYINDLETPVHLYKYVDDSTLFEVCERNGISLMQESVDIAAKWTEEKEKSKEMIISFAKNGNFRNTIPNIKIDGINNINNIYDLYSAIYLASLAIHRR